MGPFVIFMGLLAIPDLLAACGISLAAAEGQDDASWWMVPQIWLYSLQTIACGCGLWWWRKHYELRPGSGLGLAVATGLLGIGIWILPGFLHRQLELPEGWWRWLGFADRSEGFDPSTLKADGAAIHAFFIVMRFCRLVVIVPLVEEIFWRGFLMRLLADPEGDYWKVPFGTHHVRSLIVVTALFVLAHSSVDYLGATIYGLLTYWLAVHTKSLLACVVMHATANGMLGIYILTSQQWGYW